MDIVVLVTTYNRANMLSTLIDDIVKEKGSHNIHIVVANDASDEDYTSVYSKLIDAFGDKCSVIDSNYHYGKQKYYYLINAMFNVLKELTFDYVIQVPDDVRLVHNFFNIAVNTFESISDKQKVCLNILNDFTRTGPLWTNITPKKVGNIFKTGWVDMCYIANRLFFESLNYEIFVNENFSSLFGRSSGVGMEISKRITSLKLGMYQVKKSLVAHGLHHSVMHGKHREETPLITNHELVTANVASMPPRVKSLEKVVESIIDQVDELNVYLNNFDYIPEFLNNDKINVFLEDIGDLGDVGKFFAFNKWKPGYIFTIDDDIIYPSDYVFKMILAIERYNRKGVVTIHGRRFVNMPIHSYYHSICDAFRCFKFYRKDEFIHIPGTGVMAFHTDTIKPDINDFELINMADIWMGKLCQTNKVPVIMMAHDQNWVKDSPYYDKNYSIYNSLHGSDKTQTDIVNSINWELYTCPLSTEN